VYPPPVTHLKFHPHVFSPSAFDPGSDPFDASVGPAVSPAVDEPVDYPVEPDVDVDSNDYHSRGKTHNQQMWL
jgi:hypothetical protein